MTKSINCAKIGVFSGLCLLLGVTGVQATPIDNFVGAFAPSAWDLQPDQGQTYFANANTELDIIGPTGNFFPSYDAVSVTGPVGAPQWEVDFHWAFNAGDSEGTTASISWGGEPGGNPVIFASGGPGTIASGDFAFILDQGDTATILLDSGLTGASKVPSSFAITSFSYSIPDSTPWIESALFLPLLMARFLPRLRRQS